MEEAVRQFVDFLIPIVEAIGAIVIFVGVIVTFVTYVLSELRIRPVSYERVRLRLGRFLALGIEFQLGSDILSTAVSPSFAEIGKLGAIAAIRTALNYFLAKELEREHGAEAQARAGDEGKDDAGPGDGGPHGESIPGRGGRPVAGSSAA
jgi:uncharacterized membrane protein